MTNLLADYLFGGKNFGLVWDNMHPYLSVFGLEIYLYALVIVSGMAVAILVAALYFKKRGYDPYDATIYALVVIPLGVLGARAYVYIFPWSGQAADWSGFFRDFRNGGLGIYGGVIVGYIGAFVCSKIKKQNFRLITDSLLPGVMIAQSMGRWGNFFNHEAYGNLITNVYTDMPNWFEGLNGTNFHGFNGVAVWIPGGYKAGWYQATFFYESVCTLVGFLICVLVLTRSKHYKQGWCTAFYGIYYGIVRLIIEGMRSDSLYLYLGTRQTDIKISQLVSIFTICLGLLLLSQIYRKQLHNLYTKFFKTEKRQLQVSRWVLLGVSVVSLGVGITMFVLGGESKFIIGFFATILSVYSALGIWSICDRLQLYCDDCDTRTLPQGGWQTDHDKYFAQTVVYAVVCLALFVLALFGLCKMGIADGVPNGYVLAVVSTILMGSVAVFLLYPAYKNLSTTPKTAYDGQITCPCGNTRTVKLNSFLLFLFPPKVYKDYGVAHLTPWVDKEKLARQAQKRAKKIVAEIEAMADEPDDGTQEELASESARKKAIDSPVAATESDNTESASTIGENVETAQEETK